MQIRYTLLTDGSSDRVLAAMIDWLLTQLPYSLEFQSQWAEPSVVNKAGNTLDARIRAAHSRFPCDILVVHRDSEADSLSQRTQEVLQAIEAAGVSGQAHAVAVPVRMTEAWLLFDEGAIRRAAGNPHGRVSLELPALRECESILDPKKELHDLLRAAYGLAGRRASKFRPAVAVHRLAEEIDDFGPLRSLPAFTQFEESLSRALDQLRGRESVSGGVVRRR